MLRRLLAASLAAALLTAGGATAAGTDAVDLTVDRKPTRNLLLIQVQSVRLEGRISNARAGDRLVLAATRSARGCATPTIDGDDAKLPRGARKVSLLDTDSGSVKPGKDLGRGTHRFAGTARIRFAGPARLCAWTYSPAESDRRGVVRASTSQRIAASTSTVLDPGMRMLLLCAIAAVLLIVSMVLVRKLGPATRSAGGRKRTKPTRRPVRRPRARRAKDPDVSTSDTPEDREEDALAALLEHDPGPAPPTPPPAADPPSAPTDAPVTPRPGPSRAPRIRASDIEPPAPDPARLPPRRRAPAVSAPPAPVEEDLDDLGDPLDLDGLEDVAPAIPSAPAPSAGVAAPPGTPAGATPAEGSGVRLVAAAIDQLETRRNPVLDRVSSVNQHEGLHAEAAVVAILDHELRDAPWMVRHNIDLRQLSEVLQVAKGGGDLDHLVLARDGVTALAIETKNTEQIGWTNTGGKGKNHFRQVARSASLIRRCAPNGALSVVPIVAYIHPEHRGVEPRQSHLMSDHPLPPYVVGSHHLATLVLYWLAHPELAGRHLPTVWPPAD